MKIIRIGLLATLAFGLSSQAAETEFSTARDYGFSMAGALINQHCEETWEEGNDISINACRYRFAQLYNYALASDHFERCTASAGGDIVKIAECMTENFQGWLKLQDTKEP